MQVKSTLENQPECWWKTKVVLADGGRTPVKLADRTYTVKNKLHSLHIIKVD